MRRRQILLALGLLAFALPAHAEERKKGGGDSFIQLQTLTATVIRADGRRGVMTVETGIDVPDAALHSRADQSTPRLRAAFAQVLQIYATGLPGGAVPNADYLARQLQQQTDAVLGRPGARLLLGTIMVN
ncbi:Tat pathway signal protein [Caulobacter sp. KR2-114]|uniref:Tat pathway signal protein n=1 Tax=Caulobacter sp. KR2-114 TaxID=3400912 RepID=UPI003C0A8182